MTATMSRDALPALRPVDQSVSTFDLVPAAWDLASKIAKVAEIVPKGMVGRPEAVMAVMLRGHELGLDPMLSLSQIHVIEGRVAISAELMRALVLRAGHEIGPTETTSTRVTMTGRRRGSNSSDPYSSTWTLDDAKSAGLAGKANWRSYPRAMLIARATSELCRTLFPDVIGGMYVLEEVADMDGEAWDEPVPDPAPRRAVGATRKAAGASARPRSRAKPAAIDTTASDGGPALPPLPHELEPDVDAGAVEAPAPAGEAGPDADAAARARQIAMRAQQLDVDRADVIYAVTGGRTVSGRECTRDEALAVLEQLRLMKLGARALDLSGDEPRIVEVEPEPERVPAELVDPGGGDADFDFRNLTEWDGDRWREYLSVRVVKPVAAIKAFRAIAGRLGEDLPNSIDGLAGRSVSLLSECAAWVEDQAGGGS